MMSEPFKLYRLQQVDSQLDQARKRQSEIEVALKDQEELHRSEELFETAKMNMDVTQKDLKRAEEDVQAQQIKVEQNQSRLYGGKVTNSKELQDLQQEEDAIKRLLTKLEDVQLECMVVFEQAETDHDSAQVSLETIRAKDAARIADLTNEQSELDGEFQRLQGEREAATAGIPADDLNIYNKLRESRAGIAVSIVSDKSCTACGSELPQALAQAARAPDKLSHCENCGRILYSG